MSEQTLYAHYRKWCFFSELSAVAADTFRERLDKKHGERVEILHGHRLYPLVILDQDKAVMEKAARRRAEAEVNKVRGKVRVLCDQNFTNEVLEAGTELTWLAPRWHEKKYLNEGNGLVVMWRGKRRYLRGKDVEQVHD
jgi:hypothetical protein